MSLVAATIRERLREGVARLAAAGVETPRVDAEWLLAEALGVPRGRLHGLADAPMSGEDAATYEAWVRRRARREPLQHIVGTQAFRDITVRVGPDVLVPRPETELLVSWALELLPPPGADRPVVVDVGTGSGCIACALAHERPDLDVIAVDVSPAAAALARDNAAALGLSARVRVRVGDLFAAIPEARVDLIVANPPYLRRAEVTTLAPEIRDYEPRMAVDGGPDGLDVIRRLVDRAPARLRSGGSLVLETGGGEQADVVTTLLRRAGIADVTTREDLTGVTRFVAGRRSSAGFAGREAPLRGT